MFNTELSELDRERLAAFKAAMTRSRWFILTTVLIACLMLLHLFTGEYGYQTHQLKHVLQKRIHAEILADTASVLTLGDEASVRPGVTGVMRLGAGAKAKAAVDSLRRLVANRTARILRDSLAFERDLARTERDVAEAIFERILANRAFEDLRMREGHLPLIGVATPANDYIAIMTWMLLIFSTALWLSIRSMEATITSLRDSHMLPIVRLYTTFTGLVDDTRGAQVAKHLQYVAMWLPSSIYLATIVLDAGQAWLQLADIHTVYGEPVYVGLRMVLFAAGAVVLLMIAASNSQRLRRLDHIVYGADVRNQSSQKQEIRRGSMGASVLVPAETRVKSTPTKTVPRNAVILYEHRDFDERGRVRTINVTEYQPQLIHSLHTMDFKDCLSSLRWNLEEGIVVTLFEHDKGGGRQYQIWQAGEDDNTHDNNFKDCASSWAWHRTGPS